MTVVLSPIEGFAGQLIGPDHAAYDEARRVHNGLIDKRPVLIARCLGVADVVAALAIGREHHLPIAIRGGGHNVGGRATVDNGIVIDLSLMKGLYVDPRTRRARAQGGLTWGEFNRETQVHGLAVTGGAVSTTGIAGLTLGGGVGYLMGRHGLTIDSLQSAEVVTADGQVLNASDDEHQDLFWALRGGGGNFGVVTSFEYRLQSVGPMVTGGVILYPYERAADVLRFYRDASAAAPDDVTLFGGLLHGPDGTRFAGIVCSHCGSLEAGEAALAPLRHFGSPVLDAIGPITYCDLNSLMDAASPRGAFNYWKSTFLNDLSDAAIQAMIDAFETVPSPMSSLLLEHWHGRAVSIDPAATAFPHRRVGFNLAVLSQWPDAAGTEKGIAWARHAFAAMQPFARTEQYINYMGDEDQAVVQAAYGPNYARLQSVKARYDPENLFRLNQNIRPA